MKWAYYRFKNVFLQITFPNWCFVSNSMKLALKIMKILCGVTEKNVTEIFRHQKIVQLSTKKNATVLNNFFMVQFYLLTLNIEKWYTLQNAKFFFLFKWTPNTNSGIILLKFHGQRRYWKDCGQVNHHKDTSNWS